MSHMTRDHQRDERSGVAITNCHRVHGIHNVLFRWRHDLRLRRSIQRAPEEAVRFDRRQQHVAMEKRVDADAALPVVVHSRFWLQGKRLQRILPQR